MRRLQPYVTDEQDEAVRVAARRQGLSISAFLRQRLLDWLERRSSTSR